jgi:hypothetical protein
MVNVWVSAPPGQAIYCSEIDFGVRTGNGAGEFCTDQPRLAPSTTSWVVAGVVRGDDDGPGPPRDNTTFFVRCPSAYYWKIDYQLAFSLTTGSVNPVPDTFQLIVVEYSAPDNPAGITPRRSVFTLQKAPVQLYLDNLISVPASTAQTTVPKTEFGSGEAIRLIWESNGTLFSLYGDGSPQPLWTGRDTSYTVANGADRDTTYTLVATMDGIQAATSATVGISITNPMATPRSDEAGRLTVSQTARLTGDVSSQSATVDGKLTVTGAARLALASAPWATVNGPATLSSATLAATTVSGAIGGDGSLAPASARVTGLTVNGSLSGLASHPVVPGKSYTAISDGILTGTVWFTSDSPGAMVAAGISGTCSSTGTAQATGGNINAWGSFAQWMMARNANSFALPVPRGSSFQVAVQQLSSTPAPCAFAWIPLGLNTTAPEADPGPAGLPELPRPEPVTLRSPSLRPAIDHLVRVAADIFGDRLTAARGQRLTAALESIVRRRALQEDQGETS